MAFACVLGTPAASGQALGPEFRVNAYTTYGQVRPRVAAGPSGGFVVVWENTDQNGSPVAVLALRYDGTGAPLGTEFRVNTYTTFARDGASVACDSSGRFVVVWHTAPEDGGGYGSGNDVVGQRYDSAGAPLGTEFRVSSYTTGGQQFPSVASDAAGNFVAVWTGSPGDGSYGGIFGQRYAGSGAPLGTEFRLNTYTTSNQDFAAVASDSSGNFVVVWESFGQDGDLEGIFGRRYGSAGMPLGAEFQVNSYTTGNQMYPSVASDSGGFVVVWQSSLQDGSDFAVFARRYDSAGALLGTEFRVNTYTTGHQGKPAVARDSGGSFAVVWQGYFEDGFRFGVFGQRYASDGAPLGAEFRANTYTVRDQTRPTVASTSGGSFVVLWQSYLQDGSLDGVFGQRFCFGVPAVTPPPAVTTTQTLCM